MSAPPVPPGNQSSGSGSNPGPSGNSGKSDGQGYKIPKKSSNKNRGRGREDHQHSPRGHGSQGHGQEGQRDRSRSNQRKTVTPHKVVYEAKDKISNSDLAGYSPAIDQVLKDQAFATQLAQDGITVSRLGYSKVRVSTVWSNIRTARQLVLDKLNTVAEEVTKGDVDQADLKVDIIHKL